MALLFLSASVEEQDPQSREVRQRRGKYTLEEKSIKCVIDKVK
jgi:hypothetical protein